MLAKQLWIIFSKSRRVSDSYPAAKTLPSVEKAQQRPLVSDPMAWGDFSSMFQNRTKLKERAKQIMVRTWLKPWTATETYSWLKAANVSLPCWVPCTVKIFQACFEASCPDKVALYWSVMSIVLISFKVNVPYSDSFDIFCRKRNTFSSPNLSHACLWIHPHSATGQSKGGTESVQTERRWRQAEPGHLSLINGSHVRSMWSLPRVRSATKTSTNHHYRAFSGIKINNSKPARAKWKLSQWSTVRSCSLTGHQ